jgi:hypothetical protein
VKRTRCGVWLAPMRSAGTHLEAIDRTWRDLNSKPSMRFQRTKEGALRDLLRRRRWFHSALLKRAAKAHQEAEYLESLL